MQIRALDHIVLCVSDIAITCRFYERVLNMQSREERPGKWSLHFGMNKISLQDARASPAIARDTVPGSGNFCLLTDTPMDAVILHLERQGIEIVDGPGERAGALGAILSVYFKDPDGNLIEVSNQLQDSIACSRPPVRLKINILSFPFVEPRAGMGPQATRSKLRNWISSCARSLHSRIRMQHTLSRFGIPPDGAKA